MVNSEEFIGAQKPWCYRWGVEQTNVIWTATDCTCKTSPPKSWIKGRSWSHCMPPNLQQSTVRCHKTSSFCVWPESSTLHPASPQAECFMVCLFKCTRFKNPSRSWLKCKVFPVAQTKYNVALSVWATNKKITPVCNCSVYDVELHHMHYSCRLKYHVIFFMILKF
jgi:hypothetical protein